MGTETRSQQKKQKTTVGSPVVTARNLVPAVIAKAKANVFGGMKAFHPMASPEAVCVVGGDVRPIFERIASRCDVAGVKPPTARKMDDAVIALADDIAARSGYAGDLDAGQVRRIALEYVLAGVFSGPTMVESFARYLAEAREFRKLVKALKNAERLTTADAFDANDEATVSGIIETGKHAWSGIVGLLSTSPFLAVLRTQIATPILYANGTAWGTLQAVEPGMREAVVSELKAMVAEAQNPICTIEMIHEALARVHGNLLLSEGNAYGVSIAAFIETMGANAFAGTTATGKSPGKEVAFAQASLLHVGSALAGLRGSAKGTIARVDDRSMRVELTITEGLPGNLAVPVPAARPYAHASAW